jgi:GGDEF domain-containing protein
MLAGIDFPWDIRPIIESHHERWDGKGYPHNLCGEGIPLSARILSVADVYDALTSVRSYKNALGHEAAMQVMRADIGTAFDPRVFATFEAVMQADDAGEHAMLRRAAGRAEAEHSLATLGIGGGDAVTGLPDRTSMERITAQALADRKTTDGVFSILLLELVVDEPPAFDAVTQRRVLRWMARELRDVTRTSDFVARTGPVQFMALLADSSARQADTILGRVAAALSGGAGSRRTPHGLARGIRMAVVTAPADGETAAELFENAERAAARSADQIRSPRAS